MDLGLRGKVALITGGSQGIGKAVGLGLAREGADLALCARRGEPLRAAAEEISRETGRAAVPIQADMTRMQDVERAVADTLKRFGRIDILINNAGSAPGGLIENLTEEDWQEALQLKFMGYVRMCKAVLPHMRKQGRGRIINIVGNDGIKPASWEVTAGAANAADLNLTQALAEQYGPENILVNAVNPGPVATERWDGLVRAFARDKNISMAEASQKAVRSLPLGRTCRPEEVADLVVFLASERASYINGALITIDGAQRKALMDA